jgi:glycosyltransferase involved in cell wall biosynthesis
MDKNKSKTVFFSFIKPKDFSGQSAQSDILINSLSAKGIKCVPILLYSLDRNHKNHLLSFLRLLGRQITIFPNLIRLAFFRKPILHLNLGQSYWSFLRVSLWYFPVRLVNRGIRVITSLNGHVFMQWEREAFITKYFMTFLSSSSLITVVGEKQKRKLEQFGLSPDKIRVVPNSCNLKLVSESFIKEKHSDPKAQVNLLHLSLLIESKGFPIYLEALEILAKMNLVQSVRAVLCGPLVFTKYCNRFSSVEDKRLWIERKVELINRISNGQLTIEWIPGAAGEQKQKLFEESHIFIFPSSFPVEAQPVVLLEALASGCSIITSTAGEISSTLNQDCAIFIEKPEPRILADETYKLITNPDIRGKMAINGAKLIQGPLSLDHFIDTWEKIFFNAGN